MAQNMGTINQPVERERWTEYFKQLTNSNQGRLISLEVIGEEIGDQQPVDNQPLMSVIYDPKSQSEDLTISIGREQVAYSHIVSNLSEVQEAHDENGKVVALEMNDQSGNQTIMSFQT